MCEWALQAQHLRNLDPFSPCGTFHKRGQLIAYTDSRVLHEALVLGERGWGWWRLCSSLPSVRSPPTPPGLCSWLGSRLAYCLCRWVLERAHPLQDCSHGNSSDSEQLVFVFFGNVATAGILTGTGRSDMQKRCQVGLMWKKKCFPSDILLCVFTSTLSYLVIQLQWNSVFFTYQWAMLIKWSLCFSTRSMPQADRLNLFLRVHNPQVDHEIRFSQMTSG